MVHGHDDGRAAEGAVARREHLGVGGAHAVPLGRHPVARHQVALGEVGAFRLLADRGDHHAAVDLVLGALDHHRAAPAVFGVGRAEFGPDAGQRQTVAFGRDRNLLW